VALRLCPLEREGSLRCKPRGRSDEEFDTPLGHCTIELETTFTRRRVEREKLSRVTKALALFNSSPRNRGARASRRPVSEGRRERSPSTASPRRTEGTCRSITRISSFAGRVTEAAVPRKGECSGRTWGALALRNAYDVFRRPASPVWRQKVSGRRLAGAHGGSRSRASERANLASSTHSLPNHATSRAPYALTYGANERRVARKPPYPATDRRWDVPPGADEGATKRNTLHRASLRTKAGRGRARSDAESVVSRETFIAFARTREFASAT